MKKMKKLIALILVCLFLLPAMTGCQRKPGLYNWIGMRVSVDNVLHLTLDVGDGPIEYLVPFDTYYALFDYFNTILGSGIIYTSDNEAIYTSKDERTSAIKEKVEDELIEYYALYALAEHYGVGLTETDYTAFEKEYKDNLKQYLINKKQETLSEELDSYTDNVYEKFFEQLGITEDYFKFCYLHELLVSRIKQVIMPDLASFAESNYYHIKQVLITYTKGDAKSEAEAYANALAAEKALQGGADLDAVIDEYGTPEMDSELYFDTASYILDSESNDTVTSFVFMTVSGLSIGDTSDILNGEYSDEFGYFCIIRRLSFDEEMLYGESTIANQIFSYNSVSSTSYTTQYNEYCSLLDAYEQNIICEPCNEKIYKKINVASMK